MFGYGSEVEPEVSAYPLLAEVRSHFESTHHVLVEALKSKLAEQLPASTEEASGGFMKDGIDGALKCVWHEGWHTG